MMKIKIDQITVNERVRKLFDSDKLQQLSDSIKQFGQIQPIIIDQSNQLIAGERRLRACQLAGMEVVEVERREIKDDWERKAIELEENICREDLTWQEEVRAKAELHSLYQEKFGETVSEGGHGGKRVERGKDGGWGIDDTAELTGDSHGGLSQDLQLARALKENPALLQKEP